MNTPNINTKVQDLVAQAAQLPGEDQAALLAALQDLLARPDPDWEPAWTRECLDRLNAYDRGELAAVESDQAMDVLRRKHGLA